MRVNVVAASSIGHPLAIAFGVLFVLAGVLVALMTLYLVLLAVAALFRQRPEGAGADGTGSHRVVVLVPAHDEADFIARCVGALSTQTYPRTLYEIAVIADNCTDRTATIAGAAGADVLVRDEPGLRGKGQALRWAIDQVLARPHPPHAIAVVDADAVAAPDFLAQMVRPLVMGGDAVQGESLMSEPDSPQAALRAAAFLLINRVRPSGRAALGLPCNLAGNGMLLSRKLLLAHPWSAFSSAEDLEYSIAIRLRGVRPVFARGAILRSPVVTGAQAIERQRLRWEGGKLHVARTRIPALVAGAIRRRQLSLLDAAVDLAVPPLGLLAAATLLGAVAGAVGAWAGIFGALTVLPWLVASVLLPLYVLIGFRAGRAPAWAYRAMARAPLFVCGRALRIHRLLRFRPDTWVRGQRPSEQAAEERC